MKQRVRRMPKTPSFDELKLRIIRAQMVLDRVRAEYVAAVKIEFSRQVVFGVRVTRREREVLALVAQNLVNKEIACKLNVSVRVIKFHVSNLLNKFNVTSRLELPIYAEAFPTWGDRWKQKPIEIVEKKVKVGT